jgi:hypothetical protein
LVSLQVAPSLPLAQNDPKKIQVSCSNKSSAYKAFLATPASSPLVNPHHDAGPLGKLPADFTDDFLRGSAYSSACPGTKQIYKHGSQQASYKHFWDGNINLSSQTTRNFS